MTAGIRSTGTCVRDKVLIPLVDPVATTASL